MDRYFNPFQGIDVSVPVRFHDDLSRYCQGTSESFIDHSPFPRMIDMWFLAVCVAARMDLSPVEIEGRDTRKIIDASILSSDPWRVHILMLIALEKNMDIDVISKPRKVMTLSNGLAVAGLPKVIEMLHEGNAEPIWNLSDSVDEILRKHGDET